MPGRRRRRAQQAALRNRVSSNVFSTAERWESRQRAALLGRGSPWLAPMRDQTVSYAFWFAALSWQMIYEYLEGNTRDGEAPPDVVAQAEQLAAAADGWTDFAVRMDGQQANVPAVTLQPFRPPPVTETSAAGVWRMADEIVGRVERDLAGLTVPARFTDAKRELTATLQSNAQLMAYLREQYLLATEPAVQANLAQRALPAATALFDIGQKLQAPYLLGPSYAAARSRPPSLDELGFDPWVLTDPVNGRGRRGHANAEQALLDFWEGLADPQVGVRLAQELAVQRQRRRIRYRNEHGYPNAPWPPQWLVRYPVTFGARSFVTGDLISLFVSDAPKGSRALEVRKAGHIRDRRQLLGM